MWSFLVATLLAGGVFQGVASAEPELRVDCERWRPPLDEGQSTPTYLAVGYVVTSIPGATVTLRCYATVEGTEVASSFTRSGTTAVVTYGQITYTASETDEVALCAEWTIDGGAPRTRCFSTAPKRIPPQPVVDFLDDVFVDVVDPVACPAIAGLGAASGGGVPWILYVDPPTGDVSALGIGLWDCPPYGGSG